MSRATNNMQISEITKVFADQVIRLRKENHVTQDTLGKQIGASQPAVASWENNAKEASCTYALKIANVFNVTVDYLFGSTQKYPDKYFQETGLSEEAIDVLVSLNQSLPLFSDTGIVSRIIASPHFAELVFGFLLLVSLCNTIEEDMKNPSKTVDDLQGYIKLLKLGKYDLGDYCFNILCDISSTKSILDKLEKSVLEKFK